MISNYETVLKSDCKISSKITFYRTIEYALFKTERAHLKVNSGFVKSSFCEVLLLCAGGVVLYNTGKDFARETSLSVESFVDENHKL